MNIDDSNRQQYLSHLSENINYQQHYGDVNASLTNDNTHRNAPLTNDNAHRNAQQYVNGLYSGNVPEGNGSGQVFSNDNEANSITNRMTHNDHASEMRKHQSNVEDNDSSKFFTQYH